MEAVQSGRNIQFFVKRVRGVQTHVVMSHWAWLLGSWEWMCMPWLEGRSWTTRYPWKVWVSRRTVHTPVGWLEVMPQATETCPNSEKMFTSRQGLKNAENSNCSSSNGFGPTLTTMTKLFAAFRSDPCPTLPPTAPTNGILPYRLCS